MNIEINLTEVMEDMDIRYSGNKDYVVINGQVYSLEDALILAELMIRNGSELLSSISGEVRRKIR